MATATIYAGAGDGFIRRANSGAESWATLRDATSGSDVGPTSTADFGVAARKDSYLYRMFLPFDLSSIPDGSDITAVDIYVYVTAKASGGGGTTANNSVTVVESTQASATTLVANDYDNVGSTEFVASRSSFSGMTTSAYNTFSLNAAGIAAAQAAANGNTYLKVALRSGYDLDNVAPTPDTAISDFETRYSEYASTTYDPYVVITYSPPARTTSDSWAWSDSNTVSGSGGTLITQPRTTGDAWAWSDACTEYWRASRQPVLVRAAGANTTLSGAQTGNSATITVASTTGFPSSGQFMIIDTADVVTPYKQTVVTYTGKTGTTFTGCTGGEALSFSSGVSVCANDAENAFPSIIPLSTGDRPRLLAVYGQHAAHAALKGAVSKGKISSDGGRTWGAEFTVGPARVNDSSYSTGCASVIRLKNGRLLGFMFEQTWTGYPTVPWKCYLTYSDDDGATWSTASAQLADPYGTNQCVPGFQPLLYTGPGSNATYGDVYIPVYGITTGLYSGKMYTQLQKVTDGGAGGTWTNVGVIGTPSNCGNASVNECGIIALDNGTWIAHMRGEANGTSGTLDTWQATSTDLGVTWTGHTNIISSKANQPSLALMPEGHIIAQGLNMLTGYLTTWISTDQGATWPSGQRRNEPFPSASYQGYVGTNQAVLTDTTVPGRRVANVFAFETNAQDAAQVYFQWYSVESFPITHDTWAWTDSAAVTARSFSRAVSNTWAWTDSASGALATYLSRTTADTWAWSDTATRTSGTPIARTTADTWTWSDAAADTYAGPHYYSRTTSDTWSWSDSTGTAGTALYWLRAARRRSMSAPTKTYTSVQPKGTTRTATWTSPTYKAETEAGILVVLDVTAASGTGGLTLRINAHDLAGSVAVPLNTAPTAVTATGTTSYAVYPFGAISGALTQSTSGYLPRQFSITVTHGDSSSYTYSVGYCLLP